ncbi:MAG: RNA methyltransferase [Candidatus Eisenbacteria sp.]|nr:RNA methyltransferase [Candidatus Eisenbacteria bacterium]
MPPRHDQDAECPSRPSRALEGAFVILDNIRSAFNVGSIFRAADACGLEKIYLCGITAAPPNSKLDKTALGATEFVSWEYCRSTHEALDILQTAGIPILGLEIRPESTPLWETRFPERVGIVLGHEVCGVSDDILARADQLVHLPMMGIKNSHNVATACGIVLFEALRQRLSRASQHREHSDE